MEEVGIDQETDPRKTSDRSESSAARAGSHRGDRFPFLATLDGDSPRLRPVSPVRTDGFTVYVANLKSYHKTQEIAANPRVELAYLSAITTSCGSPAGPRW